METYAHLALVSNLLLTFKISSCSRTPGLKDRRPWEMALGVDGKRINTKSYCISSYGPLALACKSVSLSVLFSDFGMPDKLKR